VSHPCSPSPLFSFSLPSLRLVCSFWPPGRLFVSPSWLFCFPAWYGSTLLLMHPVSLFLRVSADAVSLHFSRSLTFRSGFSFSFILCRQDPHLPSFPFFPSTHRPLRVLLCAFVFCLLFPSRPLKFVFSFFSPPRFTRFFLGFPRRSQLPRRCGVIRPSFLYYCGRSWERDSPPQAFLVNFARWSPSSSLCILFWFDAVNTWTILMLLAALYSGCLLFPWSDALNSSVFRRAAPHSFRPLVCPPIPIVTWFLLFCHMTDRVSCRRSPGFPRVELPFLRLFLQTLVFVFLCDRRGSARVLFRLFSSYSSRLRRWQASHAFAVTKY